MLMSGFTYYLITCRLSIPQYQLVEIRMDYTGDFCRIMAEQTEIALATSVGSTPNVRIVNFYCDQKRKGVLYFATFRGNPKTREFEQNPAVAFTTVPVGNHEHVRVGNATVHKSDQTIGDLAAPFVQKIPDYRITIEKAGPMLEVYEVHFTTAHVTLGFTQSGEVIL
jgi:uncharacterized pyridoxamine 5'-phosphate oxidase family protein